MEQGIKIKIIVLPANWNDNPLPYVPAFVAWNEHVEQCAPCARVDQLAQQGTEYNSEELCEGGALLQLTVNRRIYQQHMISLQN